MTIPLINVLAILVITLGIFFLKGLNPRKRVDNSDLYPPDRKLPKQPKGFDLWRGLRPKQEEDALHMHEEFMLFRRRTFKPQLIELLLYLKKKQLLPEESYTIEKVRGVDAEALLERIHQTLMTQRGQTFRVDPLDFPLLKGVEETKLKPVLIQLEEIKRILLEQDQLDPLNFEQQFKSKLMSKELNSHNMVESFIESLIPTQSKNERSDHS